MKPMTGEVPHGATGGVARTMVHTAICQTTHPNPTSFADKFAIMQVIGTFSSEVVAFRRTAQIYLGWLFNPRDDKIPEPDSSNMESLAFKEYHRGIEAAEWFTERAEEQMMKYYVEHRHEQSLDEILHYMQYEYTDKSTVLNRKKRNYAMKIVSFPLSCEKGLADEIVALEPVEGSPVFVPTTKCFGENKFVGAYLSESEAFKRLIQYQLENEECFHPESLLRKQKDVFGALTMNQKLQAFMDLYSKMNSNGKGVDSVLHHITDSCGPTSEDVNKKVQEASESGEWDPVIGMTMLPSPLKTERDPLELSGSFVLPLSQNEGRKGLNLCEYLLSNLMNLSNLFPHVGHASQPRPMASPPTELVTKKAATADDTSVMGMNRCTLIFARRIVIMITN
jgi:hypothetical protein